MKQITASYYQSLYSRLDEYERRIMNDWASAIGGEKKEKGGLVNDKKDMMAKKRNRSPLKKALTEVVNRSLLVASQTSRSGGQDDLVEIKDQLIDGLLLDMTRGDLYELIKGIEAEAIATFSSLIYRVLINIPVGNSYIQRDLFGSDAMFDDCLKGLYRFVSAALDVKGPENSHSTRLMYGLMRDTLEQRGVKKKGVSRTMDLRLKDTTALLEEMKQLSSEALILDAKVGMISNTGFIELRHSLMGFSEVEKIGEYEDKFCTSSELYRKCAEMFLLKSEVVQVISSEGENEILADSERISDLFSSGAVEHIRWNINRERGEKLGDGEAPAEWMVACLGINCLIAYARHVILFSMLRKARAKGEYEMRRRGRNKEEGFHLNRYDQCCTNARKNIVGATRILECCVDLAVRAPVRFLRPLPDAAEMAKSILVAEKEAMEKEYGRPASVSSLKYSLVMVDTLDPSAYLTSVRNAIIEIMRDYSNVKLDYRSKFSLAEKGIEKVVNVLSFFERETKYDIKKGIELFGAHLNDLYDRSERGGGMDLSLERCQKLRSEFLHSLKPLNQRLVVSNYLKTILNSPDFLSVATRDDVIDINLIDASAVIDRIEKLGDGLEGMEMLLGDFSFVANRKPVWQFLKAMHCDFTIRNLIDQQEESIASPKHEDNVQDILTRPPTDSLKSNVVTGSADRITPATGRDVLPLRLDYENYTDKFAEKMCSAGKFGKVRFFERESGERCISLEEFGRLAKPM